MLLSQTPQCARTTTSTTTRIFPPSVPCLLFASALSTSQAFANFAPRERNPSSGSLANSALSSDPSIPYVCVMAEFMKQYALYRIIAPFAVINSPRFRLLSVIYPFSCCRDTLNSEGFYLPPLSFLSFFSLFMERILELNK